MAAPFRYARPATLREAAEALSSPGAHPMGGGTDLLVAIEDGIVSAGMVVDLRGLRASADVARLPDGSLRISAGTRIADIARDPLILSEYPALAQACAAVGTPALREMGTIGGNLCQRPRCWYLRRGIPCHKQPAPRRADACPAAEGENQYHAILEGGPCHIVHPSDPAVALTALEASIEISGISEARTVPIADFYLTPAERLDHETILVQGEFVSAVLLPLESAGARQRYTKLMQRDAWDFALVSAAAVKRDDGGVRIVLGGVAPRPWRVPESLEEDVSAGNLDGDAIGIIAERALYDARPLSRNGYKVTQAGTLLRRSIEFLLA